MENNVPPNSDRLRKKLVHHHCVCKKFPTKPGKGFLAFRRVNLELPHPRTCTRGHEHQHG